MFSILVILFGYLGTHGAASQCREVCADGWIRFQDSCYYLAFEQKLNFVEAVHFCEQHHAHLLNVETSIENAFAQDFLRKTRVDYAYIGLTDMDIEGIWRWYSNNKIAAFTDWTPGQPGHEAGTEDCAAYSGPNGYHWNDAPCAIPMHPFCEKNMNGDDESIIG